MCFIVYRMTEKNKQRIAKRIADAGICSRREAERFILSGRVEVNGQKLDTPAFVVSDDDEVKVDGKVIGIKQQTRLWCYYKPNGLLTTYKDPKGRPTVFEKLPANLPKVVSVGRLDLNSEGLLLLTTDGQLARELELPSRGWKRKYRVRIHGKITPEIISKLAKGITVDGVKYAPAVVEIETQQSGGSNQWLTITLTEGKNREIRKLMASFGLAVNRLIRISYGPFQLGNLKEGQVKEVPKKVISEQL